MSRYGRLVAALVLVVGFGGESMAQVPPEGTGATAVTGMEPLTWLQRDNLALAELDFAAAPDELRSLAVTIAMGGVPALEPLQALGEDIDRSYPQRPSNGQTLLSAALQYGNVEAVDALLAAGADPLSRIDPDSPSARASQQDFLYLAVTAYGPWIEAEDRYDMTLSNQVLALYLKHGGDPDHAWSDGRLVIEETISPGNVEGFDMLLAAGADPWRGTGQPDPLPVRLVAQSGTIANPFIRSLVEQGFYDSVTDAQMAEMIGGATRQLTMGVQADRVAMTPLFYDRFGDYADVFKLLLEQSGHALPEETELYRLLYQDDHLYRD